MSKSIYLISTASEARKNKYKIGKHTGSQSKLILEHVPY